MSIFLLILNRDHFWNKPYPFNIKHLVLEHLTKTFDINMDAYFFNILLQTPDNAQMHISMLQTDQCNGLEKRHQEWTKMTFLNLSLKIGYAPLQLQAFAC